MTRKQMKNIEFTDDKKLIARSLANFALNYWTKTELDKLESKYPEYFEAAKSSVDAENVKYAKVAYIANIKANIYNMIRNKMKEDFKK